MILPKEFQNALFWVVKAQPVELQGSLVSCYDLGSKIRGKVSGEKILVNNYPKEKIPEGFFEDVLIVFQKKHGVQVVLEGFILTSDGEVILKADHLNSEEEGPQGGLQRVQQKTQERLWQILPGVDAGNPSDAIDEQDCD